MNKPRYEVYHSTTHQGDLYIILSQEYNDSYYEDHMIKIFDTDTAKYFIEELTKFVNEVENKFSDGG